MRAQTSPAYPQALIDLLERSGDRPCFEHGSRIVTARQTLATIRRLVAAMRGAGIGPGTGVAMLPGVSPEGFAAIFAAYAIGARVSAVRPGLTAGQFAHLLTGGIDAVVFDPAVANRDLVTLAGSIPRYSLGSHPGATDLLAGGLPSGDADPGDEPLVAAGRPDDIARITYTSGSTGQPKGCAATYGALAADWTCAPDRWSGAMARMADGLDRCLLFGTLSSPVVMNYVLLSLFHGGVAVIPDQTPQPFFPAVIERYGITGTIMTVPRLYQLLDVLDEHALDEHPFDVSSLRSVMVSGSPLHPHRLADATRRLGPVVFQAYGQSEAGSLTLLTPDELSASGQAALDSVGRPHPEVEVSVRDDQDRPVPPGTDGEIYVRTPWQTSGYWGDPEQTAEVFVDGWVRTRDLGHLDGDGFLHLVGRSRDIVIVNAMVYYAGPIERVLALHPDVDEAFVVGVPDERTGEAVHALVRPAAGRTPPREQLTALVRDTLGEGSVPAAITFIPKVLAAESGKPDKRAMLARFGEAAVPCEPAVPRGEAAVP
ncbi:AMP-dependent synthetase [Rugosimonospora africana]|uniref:AMP-dependent synthetase n=2 Tax=Rugosimonospora africana TaxID=556532 RepID=A0A8J3R2X1_9ACTN|nr:AMP-dependent synthetase [Rugosimonospora africana]